MERTNQAMIELRRDIAELLDLYQNLAAEAGGRRYRRAGDLEGTKAWEPLRRLRNVLIANEIWDEKDLYLEAQFKYAPRKYPIPPLHVLYGPSAMRKYHYHRRVKREVKQSLQAAKQVDAKDPIGPYVEVFEWSAYNLRMYIAAGLSKMDCLKHMTDMFSGYFVASDPEAWDLLRETPRAFGKNVQDCYLVLLQDGFLRRELRELWRRSCRAQHLDMM